MLNILHSEPFVDMAPAEVYASLLDEGQYNCSISTMYRLLRANDEVCERRKQRRSHSNAKPELLATAPNQVWSWDITKLRSQVKWHYYYLYVILDIFSRYVVGWLIAERECSYLAKELIAESCSRQAISLDQLIIHSDRGSPMKSKTVAQLLAGLGVIRSLSRPHVSNDNPFSEGQFKTLKYNPGFPGTFGCLEDARSFCQEFFAWYNNNHHHSALALLTPTVVHHQRSDQALAVRNETLQSAHNLHPERFVRGLPKSLLPPAAVWINPPAKNLSSSTGLDADAAPAALLTDRNGAISTEPSQYENVSKLSLITA